MTSTRKGGGIAAFSACSYHAAGCEAAWHSMHDRVAGYSQVVHVISVLGKTIQDAPDGCSVEEGNGGADQTLQVDRRRLLLSGLILLLITFLPSHTVRSVGL